ncbi:MAG: hypothetical protein R6V06_06330 [Kiritimatiellia bacterium]
MCKLCRWMRKQGFKALSDKVEIITTSSLFKTDEIERIEQTAFKYNSVKDIFGIKYKGVDIGYASISHYISCTRNYEPTLTPRLRHIIDGFLRTSIYLTDAIEKITDNHSVASVSIFNGRTFDSRPILRKCVERQITTLVYEVKTTDNQLRKIHFLNSLPHNVAMQGKLIREIWAKAIRKDRDVAMRTAESFFKKRRNGMSAGDKIYTGSQDPGLLPEGWNSKKTNIVFFSSSEDEFASIDRIWDSYKFAPSQSESVKAAASILQKHKDKFKFWIRLHPNLKGVPYAYHTDFYKLEQQFDNLSVIAPESPVSTYTLIDNADKVIVSGSTVGIESVYWQKPVILLGPAYYRDLDACYIPADTKQLEELLVKHLPVKDITPALQYGYYIVGEFGEPFAFIDISTFWLDFALKPVIRNDKRRKKTVAALLPWFNRNVGFIQKCFHANAKKQLKNSEN